MGLSQGRGVNYSRIIAGIENCLYHLRGEHLFHVEDARLIFSRELRRPVGGEFSNWVDSALHGLLLLAQIGKNCDYQVNFSGWT